ncbi:MAG: hypothetical protein KDB57_00485 [Solirubrobacterales bacterium]|nr:hypothetical protein [Solirubrobacterales bacterium]
MSDSSEGRLTPGGVAMTLLSVGIGLCALVLMYQGLGFIGVTVWGYNDSQPSFYIGVGVIFLLVGTGLFFMATLLAVHAVFRLRHSRSQGDEPDNPWMLAAGITLMVLGLSLVAMAFAVLLATPDDTSRIDVTALGLVLAASGLASATAGGLSARRWTRMTQGSTEMPRSGGT